MQYHYVVTYDSLNKTFTLDVDTADAVFHNGYFFDENTQQWLDPDSELLPFYQEDYSAVEFLLKLQLNKIAPTVVCPNHEGGFDCTPFCNLCEGNQEYRPEPAPNCLHSAVYENPDFENLTCLTCGTDVESDED